MCVPRGRHRTIGHRRGIGCIGEVLGYFSHPDEREGKVFVFPHLFAEVMAAYMAEHGATARDLDGLPLKTYDCLQITDGYAALIVATEEGLARLGLRPSSCARIAGWAQATDPLKKAGRDVLRPAGAYRAMRQAYEMAGVTPADVNVAEVHDCFTVMGAIGTEVIGKASVGHGAKVLGSLASTFAST